MRKVRALSIGVSKYAINTGLMALKWASKDATAIADCWSHPHYGGLDVNHVRPLIDSEASRSRIITELATQFKREVEGCDLAVVFVAGHAARNLDGSQDTYFIPGAFTGTLATLEVDAIRFQELTRYIAEFQCRNVLLILDCCYAANVGMQSREVRIAQPNPLREALHMSQTGRYLIASCDHDETSLEVDEHEHGLFTYHLLQGWKQFVPCGHDGRIMFDSLFGYVENKVREEAKNRGKSQSPWRLAHGGDLWLGQRLTASVAPEPPLAALEARVKTEGMEAVLTAVEQEWPTMPPERQSRVMRLLQERCEPRGAELLMWGLTSTEQIVSHTAQHAMVAITLPKLTPYLEAVARSKDEVRTNRVLEAIDQVKAHPELVSLIDRLIDQRMPTSAFVRAKRLREDKQLRLDESAMEELFLKMQSPYVIKHALGKGTLTSTYYARNRNMDTPVVVRVLDEHHAKSPEIRHRFEDLARWAALWNDGPVLRTLEMPRDPGSNLIYVVRDYIEGITLRRALENGETLSSLAALKLLRHVAEALVCVHSHGSQKMPHGGVNTSNIYIPLPSGNPNAKPQRALLGDPQIIQRTLLMDSPDEGTFYAQYLAPEVFDANAGSAADLYALGCVACELLYGRPPFNGDVFTVLHEHRTTPFTSLTFAKIDHHAAVMELLIPMLAKNPGDRPSPDTVLEEIQKLEALFRQPPPGSMPPPSGAPRQPLPSMPILNLARIQYLNAKQSMFELDSPVESVIPPEKAQSQEFLDIVENSAPPKNAALIQPTNFANPVVGTMWGSPPEIEMGTGSQPVALSPSAADMPRRLGRYEIVMRIGAGGMGTVYLANDPNLQRQVAIKVLHREFRMGGDGRGRFLREGQVLAQIRHENICPIFEIGSEDDREYLVMPYLRGHNLREMIADKPLSPRLAITHIIKIANAMQHVHQRGFIHRDLKPSNILIDEQNLPILLDFGIARENRQTESLTLEGAIIGTPAYMSPEQLRGRQTEIDGRSDIYGLGATLYTLLTQKAPFEGVGPMQLLAATLEPPIPIRQHVPALPLELEQIVARAMAKERELRYATMAEFAGILEAYLRFGGKQEKQISWWRRFWGGS